MPTRMPMIGEKTGNNKPWWRWGEIGTLVHCWWNVNGAASGENIDSLAVTQHVKHRITYDPATPFLVLYPKELKAGIQTSIQFSRSVMSNSVTPWTAACQAFLSITNSRSPLKPMSIESVMPSNHLILCHPSVFSSIMVFSDESALRIR